MPDIYTPIDKTSETSATKTCTSAVLYGLQLLNMRDSSGSSVISRGAATFATELGNIKIDWDNIIPPQDFNDLHSRHSSLLADYIQSSYRMASVVLAMDIEATTTEVESQKLISDQYQEWADEFKEAITNWYLHNQQSK